MNLTIIWFFETLATEKSATDLALKEFLILIAVLQTCLK